MISGDYKPTVLITDDLALSRLHLKHLLLPDFLIFEASSKKECLDCLEKEAVDLVLLDLLMPDVDGYELLDLLRKKYPDLPLILISISDQASHVVQCIKKGAKDYVFKDDLKEDPSLLKRAVRDVIDSHCQKQTLETISQQRNEGDFVIPEHPIYQTLYDRALRAVRGGLSMLIYGETGVGKGTLVTYIHHQLFPKSPLIAVNCGAISNSLAESELFGHEKGAFTDALDLRKGKLELAHGGILFLDEISNLSLEIQKKLLCALESRKITRVGGSKEIKLNFQLIVASNKRLEQCIEQGEFREALYFRLKQYEVSLPSLRTYPELIDFFLSHYLSWFNQYYHSHLTLTDDQLKVLKQKAWKGNIRELKNEIQVMVCLHAQGEPTSFASSALPSSLGGLTEEVSLIEQKRIQEGLEICKGNIAKTARLLSMSRSTLQGKLRKHDIYPSRLVKSFS